MPQVQIRIDQIGLPAGIPGRAREDLVLGTPASLTAIGGPFSTYRWSLISKPIDPVAPIASAAGLTSPSASTTQVTPLDLRHTYLAELLVDSGFGLGALPEDVARITFYAGPTLAADARRRPRRRPAFGERREHNVADALQPGGNSEGWARELARLDASDEDVWFTKAWAAARVFTIAGPSAQVLRAYNVASVTWNSGNSNYDVAFDDVLPDANYCVLISPYADGTGSWLISRVESMSATGFSVSFTDILLSPGTPTRADFCFRVELGVDP